LRLFSFKLMLRCYLFWLSVHLSFKKHEVPTCVKKFAVISAKMPQHFKASVSTIFNTFFKCSIFSSFSLLSSSQKCFLFCFVKMKQKTLADETNKEIFQGFSNTKKRVNLLQKSFAWSTPGLLYASMPPNFISYSPDRFVERLRRT